MLKKILISMMIALIFLGLGIFIGTKIPRKVATSAGGQADTYQAGWNAARARLEQSPLRLGVPVGTEIKNVSGVVQKIEGNKLTLKINQMDPLSDPALDIRIIAVDSNTKISLNIQKDQAQLQKEMQAFQDKMKNQQGALNQAQSQAPILPPMPFEKKDIKLSDLKENQNISVVAGENIKDKKEFTALQIDAQDIAPVAIAPVGIPSQPVAITDPALIAPAANPIVQTPPTPIVIK